MHSPGNRSRFVPLLHLLFIPINLDIVRRPADGDEVGAAVAVEVAGGQVFDRRRCLDRRSAASTFRAGVASCGS